VDDALNAEAQFDYQENISGDLLPVHAYRFDPKLFFVTSKELDFTVVAVTERSTKGQPIARYPWMKLIATLGKAEKGDPLNIIQHPARWPQADRDPEQRGDRDSHGEA
jgi:hypothetical protein